MSDWPQDPGGDMAPVLEQSIEAAKQRHPSGEVIVGVTQIVLTAQDRCDDGCGAAAVYRIGVTRHGDELILDWCGHHWRKHFPKLANDGWTVLGVNPDLVG